MHLSLYFLEHLQFQDFLFTDRQVCGRVSLPGQAPTGYLRAVPDIGSHPAARFPGV
jgi:hypothetical protein